VVRSLPAAGGAILELVIAKRPDDGDDECNPREFWYRSAKADRKLLAVACDVQRSAEGPGVATTQLADNTFSLTYLEFQASDLCERYEASVRLVPLEVVEQKRWEGGSDSRGCTIQRPLTELAPLGNGEPGHPILRLHVEWADLHPTGP
jgi:hypothetical protein